jgi:hypothetical protein
VRVKDRRLSVVFKEPEVSNTIHHRIEVDLSVLSLIFDLLFLTFLMNLLQVILVRVDKTCEVAHTITSLSVSSSQNNDSILLR